MGTVGSLTEVWPIELSQSERGSIKEVALSVLLLAYCLGIHVEIEGSQTELCARKKVSRNYKWYLRL